MGKNQSKRKRKAASYENTSAPISTLEAEESPKSYQIKQDDPEIVQSAAAPKGSAGHLPATSGGHRVVSSIKERTKLLSHSRAYSHRPRQEDSSNSSEEGSGPDPSIVNGEAAMPVLASAGSEGNAPVKQGSSSKVHFFKDARGFLIKDTQFYSAGRDVNVNTYFEDRSLGMIPYAEGAGIDTTKACLEGTRADILTKIKGWITNTDAAAPRVLWLSGPAGTGKSAIAHTIARWWIGEQKGIGSCFCFNRQAAKRHEKLFSTIARDLAGRIQSLKDHLITLVTSEPALATTPDVYQQWQKLIETPVSSIAESMTGPVVIIIDALDESGDALSRRHILSILKQDVMNLSNFRIFVTSRPLPDISKAFRGASGVGHESMDQISRSSTEHDICFYISRHLEDIDDDIDDGMLVQLTQKADGLFEWARLACEYIKYADDFLTKRERFQELIVQEGEALLDNTYMIILQSIMGDKPNNHSLGRFRSVLRLVLSTREPLPMDSLDVLHSSICKDNHYGVVTVLQRLGSLLSGISIQSMPVRALHSTFIEFLTTHDRSGVFFVDLVDTNQDLGSACLQVMQQHLCFNICKLKSSYVCNSEVAGLEHCIQQYIKPHLSYACQFWADHIKLAQYQESLAGQISLFLLNERILFWLEVLGLLNLINLVPTMLSNAVSWLEGYNHDDAVEAARDCIKFSRMMGGIISESTPHLYLSGLPFLPSNSILSKHMTPKFPRLPKIASGGTPGWPQLQLLIRHTDLVKSVAFSPDGKRIVSSHHQTIYIWDAETGTQAGNSLKGHTHVIYSVAFSPDGKKIASGSHDKTVYIWDAETGAQIGNPLKGHTSIVTSVVFSPDGKTVVSGSHDQTVCLWDAETGIQIGHPIKLCNHQVNSVAFSPDGNKIAIGLIDGMCIWDAKSESRTQIIYSPTNSVAFLPDGKRIASASSFDQCVYIWDAKTGVQMGNPLEGEVGFTSTPVFSPDGTRIASSPDDKLVYIWDAETGVQVGSPLKGNTSNITSIAFSPDGKRIVSGSINGTLCIWDTDVGPHVDSPLKDHTDAETGMQVVSDLKRPLGSVRSVAFSPDGKRIVAGSGHGIVNIWNTETGTHIGSSLKAHDGFISSVAFSTDGRRVVSGSVDQTVCICDAETQLQLGSPLKGHTDIVSSVAFSPDGTRVVSGSHDHTVRVWDVETGVQVGIPLKGHTDSLASVAFSPDGKRIVSGSHDQTICIWDADSGTQLGCPLKGHNSYVASVAFLPDGKRVVSGSGDHTVCIWDTETGVQVGKLLKSHTDIANSIAFSPDGKRIASGSSDHTICIWDAELGAQVGCPLKGHTDYITSISFSPDGRRVASGSHDQTICVWEPETEMQAASPLVKGQLTSSERMTSGFAPLESKGAMPILPHVIKLSSATEHALCDAFQLFENTPEFHQDWRCHVSLNSHGWITGPQGRLLMWLPPAYQKPLLLPKIQVIIPKPAVELNLGMMVHGCTWDRCYDG